MHSTLPLLALTLLGALVLPSGASAQALVPVATPDSAGPSRSTALLAEVLTSVPAMAHSSAPVLAGNVVDEWGNPLRGATVQLLGDQLHSVSTNSAGDYLLPAAGPAPIVRVSFAGYHDAERVARGPADLLFKLDPITDYKRDLKKRSKAAKKTWNN